MATSSRHRILLLTQHPALEAEFRSACNSARLKVIDTPASGTLDPLLRRGVDLVAFDLALSNETLAAGITALDQFPDVPILGLGKATEGWLQLLRGSCMVSGIADKLSQSAEPRYSASSCLPMQLKLRAA